jgi:uncharacterized protein YneF (UPF0154 family)
MDMGAKTKSILLIIFTLLTGVGIGMWVSGRLLENRLDKMRELNTHQGLRKLLFEDVNLNAEQQDYVDSLFQEQVPRMRRKMREMAQERKREMDRIITEVKTILDEDQLIQFEAQVEKMQRFGLRRGPGRGAFPPGRPPHGPPPGFGPSDR